jgi:hypothetical protein
LKEICGGREIKAMMSEIAKPHKVYLISEWAGHTNEEACGDQTAGDNNTS